MTLSEMLLRREVQKVDEDKQTARRLVKVAQDSIVAAEDNCKIGHPDVALSLAYAAMLNSGRALMAAKGYRPSTEAFHKSVVNFCAATLPSESSSLVALFNRYRVRRLDIMYGEMEGDSVGENEAKNAVARAKEFLTLVSSKIS